LALGGIGQALTDAFQAHPLHPLVDPLQVPALLAVELGDGADRPDRLFLGGDAGQDLRAADVQAGRAADVDLVAAVDADHADVLAGRLRAVARTAGDAELDLGGRPGAPHELLEPHAQAGGVLGSEPAPLGTHAGLHRAQALGVGVARDHAGRVEVGPDRR